MKCNEMKRRIRQLEIANRKMTMRLAARAPLEERRHRFNLLDIIVRPGRADCLLRYELDDSCKIDMRVIGNEQCPTVGNCRTIQLSALDLLKENKKDFIKRMGEIVAEEILDRGMNR